MYERHASVAPITHLSQMVERSLAVAVAVLVVLVLACTLILICSQLRRRGVMRRGQMPPEELKRWREALVEKVGEASQTRGAHVTLGGFWRQSQLSAAQKYVLLTDLLKRQVFYAAYSPDRFVAFFQRIRWDLLHLPVAVVRLSDQNWQKLASGASAGIVANGDVILVKNSPGAGVVSRSRSVTQTITQDLSPGAVRDLAMALRQDSRGLVPGHPLREQAESFADTLERDLARDRSASLRRTVSDVIEFAANGAGLWAATLSIIAAAQ